MMQMYTNALDPPRDRLYHAVLALCRARIGYRLSPGMALISTENRASALETQVIFVRLDPGSRKGAHQAT